LAPGLTLDIPVESHGAADDTVKFVDEDRGIGTEAVSVDRAMDDSEGTFPEEPDIQGFRLGLRGMARAREESSIGASDVEAALSESSISLAVVARVNHQYPPVLS
jgi:hypothetical protein